MKNKELLRVVVAETSVIIRGGIVVALKRIPDANVQPVEVTSLDTLRECVRMHSPDILIVNPLFGGWFDVVSFREEFADLNLKIVCLLCSVVDSNMLKGYDEKFSVCDNIDTIADKINNLLHIPVEEEEPEAESEPLSQREKEIIICVVKGMTNKAIADQLFLSIHTVITHRRNIARKLQIHSPSGLTIYAIVNKLVALQDVKM